MGDTSNRYRPEQIASGRVDESTGPALEEITLRGDPGWRESALVWQAKRSHEPTDR